MGVNIVWFKRDLRLLDHEPLAFAIARGQPLLMIYIVEPELIRNPHYRRRHHLKDRRRPNYRSRAHL